MQHQQLAQMTLRTAHVLLDILRGHQNYCCVRLVWQGNSRNLLDQPHACNVDLARTLELGQLCVRLVHSKVLPSDPPMMSETASASRDIMDRTEQLVKVVLRERTREVLAQDPVPLAQPGNFRSWSDQSCREHVGGVQLQRIPAREQMRRQVVHVTRDSQARTGDLAKHVKLERTKLSEGRHPALSANPILNLQREASLKRTACVFLGTWVNLADRALCALPIATALGVLRPAVPNSLLRRLEATRSQTVCVVQDTLGPTEVRVRSVQPISTVWVELTSLIAQMILSLASEVLSSLTVCASLVMKAVQEGLALNAHQVATATGGL